MNVLICRGIFYLYQIGGFSDLIFGFISKNIFVFVINLKFVSNRGGYSEYFSSVACNIVH